MPQIKLLHSQMVDRGSVSVPVYQFGDVGHVGWFCTAPAGQKKLKDLAGITLCRDVKAE